jgi:protein gp37
VANKSKISWLVDQEGLQGSTWNPVRGCSRKSTGCENCYAENMAHRFNKPGMWGEGLTVIRRGRPGWSGKVVEVPEHLDDPLRWRRPRRVFVCSGADLFHAKVREEYLDQVWNVMEAADRHTFMVLTKRPKRMRDFLWGNRKGRPVPNHIWLGVSAENQETADERLPVLIETPAAVRYVSAEPLLGPVDLKLQERAIDWVIAGGESGPGARPCALEWLESIVDQCRASGAAPFVKQLGAFVVSEERAAKDIEDARKMLGPDAKYRWLWRAGLEDRKGENPEEWPKHLRVREYPDVS